jgi:hypothetical protein
MDWSSAATNIQDALDAADVGDEIIVGDGVYGFGATAVYGISNRVAVTKPLVLQSLNGPGVTFIVGAGPVGPGAVRCVYLTNGAVLAGFTLTNGYTQRHNDDEQRSGGGGVWCESVEALVSNCLIVANVAFQYGGGACRGTLQNCTLMRNFVSSGGFALGGGAYGAALTNCTLSSNTNVYYGGGAYSSTLDNCSLTGNSAYEGAGARWSTLNNCRLVTNSAAQYGGGATYSTLNNCTLLGNSAAAQGGVKYCTLNNCTLVGNVGFASYGAAGDSTLRNCISYYNTAPVSPNWDSFSKLTNCCTTPLPAPGNFTNAPRFIDSAGGDLRLQADSPCINAGNNAYVPGPTDLDGRSRLVAGTVDVGAYEYQTPVSTISYLWLQQYNLPVNASTDSDDPDHDGMGNWQEWVAGTIPTNAASALRVVSVTESASGKQVTWTTVTNRSYALESSTNLDSAAAFYTVQGQIVGSVGTRAFTDTNAQGNGPFFYRVKVEH